jgi:hypothetical protein
MATLPFLHLPITFQLHRFLVTEGIEGRYNPHPFRDIYCRRHFLSPFPSSFYNYMYPPESKPGVSFGCDACVLLCRYLVDWDFSSPELYCLQCGSGLYVSVAALLPQVSTPYEANRRRRIGPLHFRTRRRVHPMLNY